MWRAHRVKGSLPSGTKYTTLYQFWQSYHLQKNTCSISIYLSHLSRGVRKQFHSIRQIWCMRLGGITPVLGCTASCGTHTTCRGWSRPPSHDPRKNRPIKNQLWLNLSSRAPARRQTAVSAHLESEQIPLFAFAGNPVLVYFAEDMTVSQTASACSQLGSYAHTTLRVRRHDLPRWILGTWLSWWIAFTC